MIVRCRQRKILRSRAIELEREEDGRWLAQVSALPGVLAYGSSQQDAIVQATTLALRVIADRIVHGEN